MAALVSISGLGDTARLRRYETGDNGRALCTHEGRYDPEGVTLSNVEFYRVAGAAQDRVGHRNADGARAVARAGLLG